MKNQKGVALIILSFWLFFGIASGTAGYLANKIEQDKIHTEEK